MAQRQRSREWDRLDSACRLSSSSPNSGVAYAYLAEYALIPESKGKVVLYNRHDPWQFRNRAFRSNTTVTFTRGMLGGIEWPVDMHPAPDLIPAVYAELRSQ